MDRVMMGSIPRRRSRRRVKAVEGIRYCACGTRLTRYNPGAACYAHQEAVRFRNRGVKVGG